MKKTLVFLIFSFFSFIFCCPFLFAAGSCSLSDKSVTNAFLDCASSSNGIGANTEGDGVTGVKAKIVTISNQLIVTGSVIAIGGIVFSGILWATSMGDDEKAKKAKNSLQWSIIGFVVMMISFPVVNAIINLVYGVSSSSN